MPVTNNHVRPSFNEIGDPVEKKPVFQGYIDNTTGVWLRHNIEYKEMELWFDGTLVTAYSYDATDKPEPVFDPPLIHAFILDALMHGKKLRSKEIKDLINV